MEIMNTRLESRKIYTIEHLTGLAKRCDWFINGNQLLILKEGIPKIIFLTTLRGNKGIKYLVNKLLPKLDTKFILIVASNDPTFPSGRGDSRCNLYLDCKNIIKKLIEFPLLIHIFVENLDTIHPKMTPIPLGILQPNMNILDEKFYNIDFSKKINLCFVCNRTRGNHSQWKDRVIANSLAQKNWAKFTKYREARISHDCFIEELQNAKFCLCIHGGGYDPCPKFFECILYGTIPIIQHSPLDEAFAKFPVVFIDDLTADVLSQDFLMNKYEELKEYYEGSKRNNVLELLTLDYWWNIIISKLN
jgi:hypothetical protein